MFLKTLNSYMAFFVKKLVQVYSIRDHQSRFAEVPSRMGKIVQFTTYTKTYINNTSILFQE